MNKEEIDKYVSNNNYINQSFSRYKNSNGFVDLDGLYSITNGLINEKILKKIIKICGSKKDQLLLEDLYYFYAIINTTDFTAKTNFLLDFIFYKENNLEINKYKHKIEKYFNGSLLLNEIFLNPSLILNNSKIDRETVFNYIQKNYCEPLTNYNLYINSTTNNILTNNGKIVINQSIDETINEDELEEENNMIAASNNNPKKTPSNSNLNALYNIDPIKCQKFEFLSKEFSNIEKQNNGVFPIVLFENMLRDINVHEVLIEIVCNFLKKKTQKSFLNFDLFKEILSILMDDDTNKDQNEKNLETAQGIFSLMAYPNNYIDKHYITKIAQKNNISNSKLQKILNSLNKQDNKRVSLNKFLDIVHLFKSELIESLEHIKYLSVIFFNQKFVNFSLEYNCILILLKGKCIEDYIIERMKKDNIFYLIDTNFWNKWKEITSSYQREEDQDNILNERKNLRMMTKNICDKNGKILDGKEYSKDFMVVSERIYLLFFHWYGTPLGGKVEREKILLDSKNPKKKTRKNKVEDIFRYEDVETKKKYEIEIYPIFLIFCNYSNLLKSLTGSNQDIKQTLKNMSNPKDKTVSYNKFSRKKKFSEIAKILKDNNKVSGDQNSTRFWVFYQDNLDLIKDMEESLEDRGITDTAVIVIETKVNNNWPSGKIKKETIDKPNGKQKSNKVGLLNIGNTCYLNSVLQIFLNIEQLKNIFIKQTPEENKIFLSFILNNYEKNSGKLMKEFINILKEKWIEGKKSITPKKFKEICGELNPIFKGEYQQDAHEFYSFLVDKLHEDSNIKTFNNQIKNSDKIDTNEEELGNECWANTVRNNASYIYGLFMGQMKSTLICAECNTKKIQYEPFSSIGLPIPESNYITIEIILFRLPHFLRKFKKDLNQDSKNKNNKINNLNVSEDSNLTTKKTKKKTAKTYVDYANDEQAKGNDMDSTIKSKNEVINDVLNLNIPLELKLEVNRTEKCSTIIDKLKSSADLNLEKNYNYIEYVMLSNEKFIDENLIIDETFLNNQKVFIYELLNYLGLRNIFKYNEIITNQEKVYLLNEQKIKNDTNPNQKFNSSKQDSSKITSSKQSREIVKKKKNNNNNIFYSFQIDPEKINDYDAYEILIPIKHRAIKDINKGFVPYFNYSYFFNYQDFIILPSKQSIKSLDLYKIMWKKYNYFLNSPANYEKYVWWKKNANEKKKNSSKNVTNVSTFSTNCIKNFLPFTLKILNKNTNACAYCPWFRFCTGCIIEPKNDDFIEINNNCMIIIEWNKEIKKREIKNTNIDLILTHSALSIKTENEDKKVENDKITIDDCFQLFTKKEELNDIYCEQCKKKTLFTKILEIERLPKYLVLVFKRFKFTAMYTKKIDKVINFPKEDLDLQNYTSQNKNIGKYNLFGIINHSGSLDSGHYYSIFNNNGVWNKYDDAYVNENDNDLETSKVYILVYKSAKPNKKDLRFNFIGLMNRAFSEYANIIKFSHVFNYDLDSNNNIIKEYSDDCQFYFGEPVTVEGNSGYLINIKKKEEEELYDVKIKLQKGYFTGKVSEENIIKETSKIFNRRNNSANEEKVTEMCSCEIY